MSDTKVYSSVDMLFVADQAAQAEATLTFVIDCLLSSESFDQFKNVVSKSLKEVKITRAISVDNFLDCQTDGYALIIKSREVDLTDYLRDDDGLPVIFKFKSDAYINVPKGYEFVRTVDLKERYERKSEQKCSVN